MTKKTMNEPDHIAAIVVGEAKRTLKDLQTRSIEALKALDAKDYQLALGAFAGLEEQIRKTNNRLQVLSEATQKQTRKE